MIVMIFCEDSSSSPSSRFVTDCPLRKDLEGESLRYNCRGQEALLKHCSFRLA